MQAGRLHGAYAADPNPGVGFGGDLANRSDASHLAGATANHASADSVRYSGDLDLFHTSEAAVSEAFEADRCALERAGFSLRIMLSQPGFIRAQLNKEDASVLIDWAHDSAWRFMPTVVVEGIGHVLHPVDLAVNKVLALAAREDLERFFARRLL